MMRETVGGGEGQRKGHGGLCKGGGHRDLEEHSVLQGRAWRMEIEDVIGRQVNSFREGYFC